ncbi:MAG: hypothetical protein KDG57_14930 [Rhodoferax sp.]|nr:hypothetical protein [Rhodoferax sp.]
MWFDLGITRCAGVFEMPIVEDNRLDLEMTPRGLQKAMVDGLAALTRLKAGPRMGTIQWGC